MACPSPTARSPGSGRPPSRRRRDVAVDERDQRDARRQHNAAVGVQAILDLQQAFWSHGVLSGTVIHKRSLGA